MPKPTLQDIFGVGATQDVITLTISKAALIGTGLSPLADNSAESLLAAILSLCVVRLQPTLAAADPTQKINISDSPATFVSSSGVNLYRKNIIVSFGTVSSVAEIVPNEY
jgi:hypothetical protein